MDEARREHEVELLVGERARNRKLEKSAAGSILKLTKIRASGRTGSEIEFEGKALAGMDGIFRDFFLSTGDGHFRSPRGDKELGGRGRNGQAGVRIADGVLKNDDEEESSESWDSDQGMKQARPDGGCGDARGYELFLSFLAKNFARVVRKGGKGLEVGGTFGTVEIMLFISRMVGRRELTENVFHGGLELCGLAMVHLCHPYQ